MSNKRVLIVTASHLCRNPRVVKEATALGQSGYDVTVLTVTRVARFEELDRALVASLPFTRQVIDYAGSDGASAMRRLLLRSRTKLGCALIQYGGFETASALGPATALLARARATPADLTILHNEAPLWAAARLARDGRRVAADFEDWYSEDLLEADRRSRPLKLLREAERFALKHAAYASTTSQSMADALAATYDAPRPIIIRNTFPLPRQSRLDRPPAEIPGLIWFSQTIGPGRGLETFLDSWSRCRQPSRVFLLGDVRPEYREALLVRVKPECRARLEFLPFVAPNELPETLTGFDVGLALEPNLPRNKDLTISNKLFQFLGAGLALVATDTAGQREVLNAAPGCGLLQANDATLEANAQQLDALLADRARLRRCQETARAAATETFSWEHDASRLQAAVERALADHSVMTPA